jgi:hypothetical protein
VKTTFSITIFSMMTLGTRGLFVTLSINNTQHNSFYCLYAECRYAECSIFIVTRSVIMVRGTFFIVMPCVITVSAVMLNVMAPLKQRRPCQSILGKSQKACQE